jgi:beta-lactamase class D
MSFKINSKFSFILPLLFFLVSSCETAPKSKTKTIKEKLETESKYTERIQSDFQTILADANLEGSILIYDFQKEKYYSNDFVWAKVERLPASTFKIPTTIIGLETGVLESDSAFFKWDEMPRKMKAWEKDMYLAEAFQSSCVPCYQEVARAIGYDKMRQYLSRFNYGKMEFVPQTIDNFWLEGTSRISQYQQIDFIERFYHDGLGVSVHTTNTTKKIMLIEETKSYSLSGKTGWATSNKGDNGWFVGHVLRGFKDYFFAVNVSPKADFDINDFRKKREEVTRKALKSAKLID